MFAFPRGRLGTIKQASWKTVTSSTLHNIDLVVFCMEESAKCLNVRHDPQIWRVEIYPLFLDPKMSQSRMEEVYLICVSPWPKSILTEL